MRRVTVGQMHRACKVLLRLVLLVPVSAGADPVLPRIPAKDPPLSFAFELGVLSPPRESLTTLAPATHSYRDLRMTPVRSGLELLRYGVAVDLALPGAGSLDLTFTHLRNPSKPPQRYKFQLDSSAPAPGERLWSLGAVIGRGRHGDLVQAVPQIVLNLPGLTGLPGKGEVMFQYSRFRSNSGDVTESSMPLITLNWQF